jgi:hypothetical protein
MLAISPYEYSVAVNPLAVGHCAVLWSDVKIDGLLYNVFYLFKVIYNL